MGKGEQLSRVAVSVSALYMVIIVAILVAYGIRLRVDVVQTAVNGILTSQLAMVTFVGILYDGKKLNIGGNVVGNG